MSFTLDEAAALLLGEKLLVSSLDIDSLQDFKQALNKIRAVISSTDKDYLSSLDTDLEVLPTGSQFPIDDGEKDTEEPRSLNQQGALHSGDRWLRECRSSIVRLQVVEIGYAALSRHQHTVREIEPIGLFYYSWHWHFIAWCRLREAYRDFRLDRILSFLPKAEQFARPKGRAITWRVVLAVAV